MDGAWQNHLSFEEVAAWLQSNGQAQFTWKARILTEAQSKMARARQADDKGDARFDSAIAKLKSDYFEVVGKEYPELAASVQTGRDREYYLKARNLPGGVRLKHSFFKGEVSLIFERKWADIVYDEIAQAKTSEGWLAKFGSELHLRQSVEVMDPILSVQDQLSVVRGALDEVVLLASFATTLRGLKAEM
jgi:HAMP domain-containing protein